MYTSVGASLGLGLLHMSSKNENFVNSFIDIITGDKAI